MAALMGCEMDLSKSAHDIETIVSHWFSSEDGATYEVRTKKQFVRKSLQNAIVEGKLPYQHETREKRSFYIPDPVANLIYQACAPTETFEVKVIKANDLAIFITNFRLKPSENSLVSDWLRLFEHPEIIVETHTPRQIKIDGKVFSGLLKNLPRHPDEWAEIIDSATLSVYKKVNQMPNRDLVWEELCCNPTLELMDAKKKTTALLRSKINPHNKLSRQDFLERFNYYNGQPS
jgi:hypothetical protein